MRYLGSYSLKSTVEGLYREVANGFLPNPTIAIGDVEIRVVGDDLELGPDREGISRVDSAIKDLCNYSASRRGRSARKISDSAAEKRLKTINNSWIVGDNAVGNYRGDFDAVFNSGLILAGILGFVFCLGFRKTLPPLGKLGSVVLLIGTLALIGVGLFP